MYDIKKLKPTKKSRYQQGYINPQSCKKLYESQKTRPIIYRSSYEKKFVQFLESNKHVSRWGSECIPIPYVDAYDKTTHQYFPDYVAEIDGVTYLFEIKPHNQCVKPSPHLPKDCYAWKTYIKNVSKWNAAKQFAKDNGLVFQIITEETIKRL